MEKQNGDGVAPENTPQDEPKEEESNKPSEDVDALKDQLNELSEQNKQLFARAKKAEGFELKDGQWVKPPKETPKEEPKVESEPSQEPSKSDDLDYGEKAYLRSAINLKGADEIHLAKEFKNKYGMSVEEMESDPVFTSKLKDLRDARATQEAVPSAKNRSGQAADTDLDYAVAKYREKGELPQDFALRNKVIDAAIVKPQTNSKSQFEK